MFKLPVRTGYAFFEKVKSKQTLHNDKGAFNLISQSDNYLTNIPIKIGHAFNSFGKLHTLYYIKGNMGKLWQLWLTILARFILLCACGPNNNESAYFTMSVVQ